MALKQQFSSTPVGLPFPAEDSSRRMDAMLARKHEEGFGFIFSLDQFEVNDLKTENCMGFTTIDTQPDFTSNNIIKSLRAEVFVSKNVINGLRSNLSVADEANWITKKNLKTCNESLLKAETDIISLHGKTLLADEAILVSNKKLKACNESYLNLKNNSKQLQDNSAKKINKQDIELATQNKNLQEKTEVINRLSTNLKEEKLNSSKKEFALNDMMKLLREERLTHLAAIERSNNRLAEERVTQLAAIASKDAEVIQSKNRL
jgi:hypothetical protein